MRPLSTLLPAAGAAAALALGLGAPAQAATTKLDPASLPRGADLAVPHLEGRTVVDGAVRFKVKAPQVRLIGKAGTSYVVGTTRSNGSGGRVVRVSADGTVLTRLGRGDVYGAELSDDGQTLTQVKPTARRTVLTVRAVDTGATVATRTFRGYVQVLDSDAGRLLLGRDRATLAWTTATDSVATVSTRTGYAGDLSNDVLAVYTKDPYSGGCTVVQRISTGARLFKNCDERVTAVNGDGTRFAMIDILADGIGPGYVAVRDAAGAGLASYEVRRGWFGEIAFETPTALLLDTNGARKAAWVRCTDAGCERASDLTPAETPRAS